MGGSMSSELAARLRAESEETREDAYPSGTTARRPHRSRVYSVRLSAEEQARVEEVASQQHLPPSTLVRAWILDRLDHERKSA